MAPALRIFPCCRMMRVFPRANCGAARPLCPRVYWRPLDRARALERGVRARRSCWEFLLFPLITLAGIFPGLMAIVYFLAIKIPGYFFFDRFAAGRGFICGLFMSGGLDLEMAARGPHAAGTLSGRADPSTSASGFADQLMDLSLEVIGTFYTTLYLGPWLRALGARIGPRSEISTIRLIHPDLLSTGPRCFLADDVMVGTPHVRAGWILIGRARLGERVCLSATALSTRRTLHYEINIIHWRSISWRRWGKQTPCRWEPPGLVHRPFYLPARQKPPKFPNRKRTSRPPAGAAAAHHRIFSSSTARRARCVRVEVPNPHGELKPKAWRSHPNRLGRNDRTGERGDGHRDGTVKARKI